VERSKPTLDLERQLLAEGASLVAGVDEVGRGAWAGPLTVSVVVVDPAREAPLGVNDSKQLSGKRRAALLEPIEAWAIEFSVGSCSAREVDALGVSAALRTSVMRALAALSCKPDALIMDGTVDLLASATPDLFEQSSHTAVPAKRVSLAKADSLCASVAAASIIAKEHRDSLMRSWDDSFPAFGFASNVGYPSAQHRRALAGYGPTAIHRTSWAFLDEVPWLKDAYRQ
jgi:ribonuclease HII